AAAEEAAARPEETKVVGTGAEEAAARPDETKVVDTAAEDAAARPDETKVVDTAAEDAAARPDETKVVDTAAEDAAARPDETKVVDTAAEDAAARPDETKVVDTAAEDAAATEQPAGERTDAPVDEGASPDTVDDAATTEQPAETRADERDSTDTTDTTPPELHPERSGAEPGHGYERFVNYPRDQLAATEPVQRGAVRALPRRRPGATSPFDVESSPAVRSAFEVRRAVQDGETISELTFVVDVRGIEGPVTPDRAEHDLRWRERAWHQLEAGAGFWNSLNLRLPPTAEQQAAGQPGDLVRFRFEQPNETNVVHHVVWMNRVAPVGFDAEAARTVDQQHWHPDQPVAFSAHENGHM